MKFNAMCLYLKVYALRQFQLDMEKIPAYQEVTNRLDKHITQIEEEIKQYMTFDDLDFIKTLKD